MLLITVLLFVVARAIIVPAFFLPVLLRLWHCMNASARSLFYVHVSPIHNRAIHIGLADVHVGPLDIAGVIASSIIIAVISPVIPAPVTGIDIDGGTPITTIAIAIAMTMVTFNHGCFTACEKYSSAKQTDNDQ